MTSKRIQFLLTGVAAWLSLLLMITTTYGASIVIGGDYTDVGTIVIVSPSPGDPTGNGTALLNNLAGISADATHPYVIKLGPGIYDIGASSLQMKQYVDIEGSGENTTTITGHIDSSTSGVVRGTNHVELRFLTVQNTGGGNNAIGIYNYGATKITNVTATAAGSTNNYGIFNYFAATMTNVTASASGGGSVVGTANYGVYNWDNVTMTNVTASASGGYDNSGVGNLGNYPLLTMTNVTASASGGHYNRGVANLNSTPTMTNVTASASAGGNNYNFGVMNEDSSPTMTNITASGSGVGALNYGVYSLSSGTIRINHSVIKGTYASVYNEVGVTTRVGATQMDGGPPINSGTLTCAGVYDENYTFYATACP